MHFALYILSHSCSVSTATFSFVLVVTFTQAAGIDFVLVAQIGVITPLGMDDIKGENIVL